MRQQVDRSALTPDIVSMLTAVDTPSICNAIEIVQGGRTTSGFTRGEFFAADPTLKPVLGFARTATLRSALPYADPPAAVKARRIAWYEHVANQGVPVIAVTQDIDERPGTGAFLGELHSNVLKGLGAVGALTNGAMRDIGMLADGFQILAGRVSPSHAFVQIVSIGGAVQIHGLEIHDGDLIHMDRHGAVIIGPGVFPDLYRGLDVMARREELVIEASRRSDFSLETLKRKIDEAELIR